MWSSAVKTVVFLVCALSWGCSAEPLAPREPTPGVFHFTVQSFNVEFEHYSDPETVDAVGQAKADLISLQEVTPEWEVVLRERYASEYEHMLFQSRPNSGGLAVLSHYPIMDLGFHEGPNEWHPAWHVGVETPEGLLQLLNVHLRSVFTGRDNAVESALRADDDHRYSIEIFSDDCVQGVPTIVLGDFNEDPEGEAVSYLEDNGYRNVLPLYRPGQSTWRHPSPGGQMEKTIDHILFDDSFSSLNAWVTRIGNSDHLPVLAHFELSPNW